MKINMKNNRKINGYDSSPLQFSPEEACRKIAGSKFFDRQWYLLCNPDVAQAQVDPAEHYLEHGWREGRNPSEFFDGNAYLHSNPDISDAGINPLLHYECRGIQEGRSCRPVARSGDYPGKKHSGVCPVCGGETEFLMEGLWLRDQYRCTRCHSLPRHRAIIHALDIFVPNWRELKIHESSPGNVASEKLQAECSGYSSSQFFPGVPSGSSKGDVRCENLEQMSFSNGEFDLFITQDVLEHIMNPAAALAEVARVLKKGGIHVFTTPWESQLSQSHTRASMQSGTVVYHAEKVFHGNPVDRSGSLVVTDWGRDFCRFIRKAAAMDTLIYLNRDRGLGLDGEYLEVFVSTNE